MGHHFIQENPKISVGDANDAPSTIPTPDQLGSLLVTTDGLGANGKIYAAVPVGSSGREWVYLGGEGTEGLKEISVPFAFGTYSPMVLQALTPGSVIARAAIVITTPFNGVGTSLRLGTTAVPGQIFDTMDTVPESIGQFDNLSINQFSVPDFLRLIISPAGSTQGAGLLLYTFRS